MFYPVFYAFEEMINSSEISSLTGKQKRSEERELTRVAVCRPVKVVAVVNVSKWGAQEERCHRFVKKIVMNFPLISPPFFSFFSP